MADHHYRLCFADASGQYNGECYDDAGSLNLATDLFVRSGQTTGGIEAWLEGETPPPQGGQILFMPLIANSD